jgi:hypothetical protein
MMSLVFAVDAAGTVGASWAAAAAADNSTAITMRHNDPNDPSDRRVTNGPND